jgi:hypothetical protein
MSGIKLFRIGSDKIDELPRELARHTIPQRAVDLVDLASRRPSCF